MCRLIAGGGDFDIGLKSDCLTRGDCGSLDGSPPSCVAGSGTAAGGWDD